MTKITFNWKRVNLTQRRTSTRRNYSSLHPLFHSNEMQAIITTIPKVPHGPTPPCHHNFDEYPSLQSYRELWKAHCQNIGLYPGAWPEGGGTWMNVPLVTVVTVHRPMCCMQQQRSVCCCWDWQRLCWYQTISNKRPSCLIVSIFTFSSFDYRLIAERV